MSDVDTGRDERGRRTRLPEAMRAKMWPKGFAPNPTGRGAEYQRCLALCRKNSFDAAQEIIRLSHESDDERVRYMAATWVYERAWGKTAPTFDPVEFAMPPLQTAADVTAAMAAVMQAASQGRITLSQAAEFGKLLQLYGQTASASDPDDLSTLTDEELRARIERRLAGLEDVDLDLSKLRPRAQPGQAAVKNQVTRIESVIIDPAPTDAGPQAD